MKVKYENYEDITLSEGPVCYQREVQHELRSRSQTGTASRALRRHVQELSTQAPMLSECVAMTERSVSVWLVGREVISWLADSSQCGLSPLQLFA